MPTRVGARDAEIAVLAVGVIEDRVAVRARADVERRVGHVVRVHLRVEARAVAVGGEDAVLGMRLVFAFVESRRRGQVRAPPWSRELYAAAVTVVDPDRVAATTAAREEVAGGEVLDAHAFGLPHLEAVAAGGVA